MEAETDSAVITVDGRRMIEMQMEQVDQTALLAIELASASDQFHQLGKLF